MDTIKITVLEDGTIKTETDPISMPNHANAEAFLKECARLAGGTVDVKRKHGHAHTHQHGHDHHHQ